MAVAAPNALLAIHGVGNPGTGEIEELVKKNLTVGGVQKVDVIEFFWNDPDLYPLQDDRLAAESSSALAMGFLTAARVGFSDGRTEYAGFGAVGIAAHNFLAGLADYFIALAVALALVLPLLSSLVLLPTYWFADYSADQFRIIGWVLVSVLLAGSLAIVLLLLLGAVYTLIGAGRRQGYATLAPLMVTARRAALILFRPIILVALPPFSLPAQTAVSKGVDIVKYANLAALLIVYPVIWWFWDIALPAYALAINAGVVALIITCWLVATVTRFIAPGLKIFLDIFRYVGDINYRQRLQLKLDDKVKAERAEGHRGFVLAAHSLGSVIAVDSLMNSKAWQSNDCVLLVTMGSPLRRFFFRFLPELFFPPSADAIGGAVAARLDNFRWANVYRPWDQVGGPLKLRRKGSAERRTGQWLHILRAHPDYWSDNKVLIAAQQALQATGGSPRRTLEARWSENRPIIPQDSDPSADRNIGLLVTCGCSSACYPPCFWLGIGDVKNGVGHDPCS